MYYYLEHQKEVLTRKTQFDLSKALEREHIVKGLVIALANIDEVIKIIKTSSDKQDAMQKLTENFELTEKQANAILEMKLSRLTSLEVQKLKDELEELEVLIADLNDILSNPQRVLQIIHDELEEVKTTYGTPRKTEISVDMGDINIEDLIPREEVVVSMTHEGYIKRQSASEYKAQRRGGIGVSAQKLKDTDFVEKMFVTNSHNNLLFFTNFGKVYRIKVYEIPEAQRQAKGRALVNLLTLSPGEKVNALIPLENGQEGNLIMATKHALIKKTSLKEFERINVTGKIAIKLNEGDELIGVSLTSGSDDVLIAASNGKCIRFNEKFVRLSGRSAAGMRSMRFNEKDATIVDMTIIKEGDDLITISENGYGKRISQGTIRAQARGGKGVVSGKFDEKTGKLVAMKVIRENEDLMLIADNGVIIRMLAKDISIVGRYSLGVKVMKLKNDAKIVSVATTEHLDEEDEESSLTTTELDQNQTVLTEEEIKFAEDEQPINE